MPIDYRLYPPNWKTEIVPHIRARSGDCCEWCGVINKTYIIRFPKASGRKGYFYVTGPYDFVYGIPPTLVCLTTAHLGVDKPDGTKGDKHDKFDTRDENLAHLCQGCHLGYDLPDHIRHRRENREMALGIVPMKFDSPQTEEI